LIDAGFKAIEATSFVSPKWVPQMSDSAKVLTELKAYKESKNSNVDLIVLAPNTKGVENAVEVGAEKILMPISVIEKHNLDNVHRTREQSFEELSNLTKRYSNVEFCIGLACALGSPYQDIPVVEEDIYFMAEKAFKVGGKGISLSDTVGNGNPEFVEKVISKLKNYVDLNKVSLHLHDTYSLAITNTLVGINNGISHFESSAAGLGGCPFAPGAAGNVATEDVLKVFEILGIKNDIKEEYLYKAIECIDKYVDVPILSRAYNAYRTASKRND
jgi:isopropylmalate/homocitrate/citramalate synthase